MKGSVKQGKRANESKQDSIKRKAKNRYFMASTRAKGKPVDTVINEFQAQVKSWSWVCLY